MKPTPRVSQHIKGKLGETLSQVPQSYSGRITITWNFIVKISFVLEYMINIVKGRRIFQTSTPKCTRPNRNLEMEQSVESRSGD